MPLQVFCNKNESKLNKSIARLIGPFIEFHRVGNLQFSVPYGRLIILSLNSYTKTLKLFAT